MPCVLPRTKDFKNGQAKTGCFRFVREVIYRLAKGRRYRVVDYKTRPPGAVCCTEPDLETPLRRTYELLIGQ